MELAEVIEEPRTNDRVITNTPRPASYGRNDGIELPGPDSIRLDWWEVPRRGCSCV